MTHRNKVWPGLKLAGVVFVFTIALAGVSLASIAAIEPHINPRVQALPSPHEVPIARPARIAKPSHKTAVKRKPVANRRPAPVSKARRVALALRFSWPVPKARITQGFGRLGPGKFHHGVDIACAAPAPVRASKAGVVILAGPNPFYGNVVVIAHPGGWSTLYGHMGHLNVRPGRWVRYRQELGTCGTTGKSTGPHVHFEIRHLGQFYNPWLFIG